MPSGEPPWWEERWLVGGSWQGHRPAEGRLPFLPPDGSACPAGLMPGLQPGRPVEAGGGSQTCRYPWLSSTRGSLEARSATFWAQPAPPSPLCPRCHLLLGTACPPRVLQARSATFCWAQPVPLEFSRPTVPASGHSLPLLSLPGLQYHLLGHSLGPPPPPESSRSTVPPSPGHRLPPVCPGH